MRDVLPVLLDRGAEVNAIGGPYGNALNAAAKQGDATIIQLLLDRGAADVNAKGGPYGSALQAAVAMSDVTITQLLLDKGAEVNAHNGGALREAAKQGDATIIQLLLDMGADINAKGGLYGSPLQAAVVKSDATIIQLLLDRGSGAEGNTQDSSALQDTASQDSLMKWSENPFHASQGGKASTPIPLFPHSQIITQRLSHTKHQSYRHLQLKPILTYHLPETRWRSPPAFWKSHIHQKHKSFYICLHFSFHSFRYLFSSQLPPGLEKTPGAGNES